MKCERCGNTPQGYDLHDYCGHCGKNLCPGCMSEGCCGKVPALSGMHDDYPDDGMRGVGKNRQCTRCGAKPGQNHAKGCGQ